ncbi:hypothetical protein J5N97_003562 [Dioscorea zingiberensis]|uniref:Uncharacterized protein n=1 Tax=Dioscorea zingiberensis TaxID=325984 RepID=A0A9D5D4F5_9LILI|nr:hypothetical protein J5N97_003562 [Dioscorea zingiberensis]
MVDGAKFTGFMGGIHGNDSMSNFYDMIHYRKLGEGSNMSTDSFASLQTSNGGSVPMSKENSSVGSNDSRTGILQHPGVHAIPVINYSASHSVHPGRVSHVLNDDALAQAGLMDPAIPCRDPSEL